MHQQVRKSSGSGRNLDLNDQLLSRKPVIATYDLNRQKVNQLIPKNQQIAQTAIMEKTMVQPVSTKLLQV